MMNEQQKQEPSFPHCPSCGSSAWFCTVCAAPPQATKDAKTPRTNDYAMKVGECNMADFARQLERELAAANAEIERLRFVDEAYRMAMAEGARVRKELADTKSSCQYHIDAINKLASFLGIRGTSFEVVQAAIDNMKRLVHERQRLALEQEREARFKETLLLYQSEHDRAEAAKAKIDALDSENARLLGEIAATCLKRKEDVRKCERIAAANLDTLVSAGKPGSGTFTARSKVAAEIRAAFPEDFKDD